MLHLAFYYCLTTFATSLSIPAGSCFSYAKSLNVLVADIFFVLSVIESSFTSSVNVVQGRLRSKITLFIEECTSLQ